ncbi:carbohydrate kinase [Marinobacterium sp. D7]|uniref:carbohydrate kinase family protein n=1 Tax=Marinobacterium ramblicola TaxID=2849041 RepID=UPI001C2D7591|nr:carbohydrate kinase [Marinobacterium ramblicola]MBV1787686.1 carbohydrate kinase [Marinobacterium ramblicola]
MNKVISFGEALIDMLSNRVGGADLDGPETFTRYPGGAPANVAVAVAKLGGRSHFAGKVGQDMFGDCLRDAMANAGVNTDYLLQTTEAKTALAFVSLDEHGERSFEFYRSPSADLLFRPEEFGSDWFDEPGIFHFCSNTLTEAGIRDTTMAGVAKAHEKGYLVSFDINLRHNLWPSDLDPTPFIWQAIEQTDLLKLCTEELAFLCRNQSEDEVIQRIRDAGVSLILVTDGGNPLRYYCGGKSGRELNGELQPPKTKVIDSTAAGDAFTGGVLYALSKRDISRDRLQSLSDRELLEAVLNTGMQCGAFAVTRKGAFDALPAQTDLSL